MSYPLTETCYRCNRPRSQHVFCDGTEMCPPRAPHAPRHAKSSVLALCAALSGVFAAISLFVALVSATAVTQCTSGTGQLAQAFSSAASNHCAAVSFAHGLAETCLIVFGAACAGLIWGASKA
jgi:hypothetical protein